MIGVRTDYVYLLLCAGALELPGLPIFTNDAFSTWHQNIFIYGFIVIKNATCSEMLARSLPRRTTSSFFLSVHRRLYLYRMRSGEKPLREYLKHYLQRWVQCRLFCNIDILLVFPLVSMTTLFRLYSITSRYCIFFKVSTLLSVWIHSWNQRLDSFLKSFLFFIIWNDVMMFTKCDLLRLCPPILKSACVHHLCVRFFGVRDHVVMLNMMLCVDIIGNSVVIL